MLVLDIEFRQLLEVIEFELLSSDQLLRVLVGDAPRSCCGSDRRSECLLPDPVTSTADAMAAPAEVVVEVLEL